MKYKVQMLTIDSGEYAQYSVPRFSNKSKKRFRSVYLLKGVSGRWVDVGPTFRFAANAERTMEHYSRAATNNSFRVEQCGA